MKVEHIILGNIIEDEEYMRKVTPFLKQDYFQNNQDRILYKLITKYIQKYNNSPSKEALSIELQNLSSISQDDFVSVHETIKQLDKSTDKTLQWLIDTTEKFCKDKALYNALMQSIQIVDSEKETQSLGAIPQILQDALGVSFDKSIGHDFIDDYKQRYDFYHTDEVRIPFKLDLLNKITNGGVPRKTLNMFIAATGVGKSMFMCDWAADCLISGRNVLYITLEMAEERIAERIDANLMNIPLQDLKGLSLDQYTKLINNIQNKGKGKLVIKEYPTTSAGANNFRHLLNELKLKKNFIPDIIFIDYLNICASSRIKMNNNVNSYSYIKAIAEELRGLAVEFDVPIISATQTNRGGFQNSDVDLDDTSESFGLPMTVDFMAALIATEELDQLQQIMIKQLKNRYGDPNYMKRFVVGVDRSRMKLYDCEQSAQDDIVDDRPVMDKSEYGSRYEDETKPPSKFDKMKFRGFT